MLNHCTRFYEKGLVIYSLKDSNFSIWYRRTWWKYDEGFERAKVFKFYNMALSLENVYQLTIFIVGYGC